MAIDLLCKQHQVLVGDPHSKSGSNNPDYFNFTGGLIQFHWM